MFATRSAALKRTPAFTFVIVVTLAAGLGLGAAAFSVIDTLLVTPLRFRSPEQLVLVHATVPPDARDTNEITYPDANDLARETQAFAVARRGHDVCGHRHGPRSARTHRGLRRVAVAARDARRAAGARTRVHGGRRRIGCTDRRHSRRRVLAPHRGARRHHRPDAGARRRAAHRRRCDAAGFSRRSLQPAGRGVPSGHAATFRGRQP